MTQFLFCYIELNYMFSSYRNSVDKPQPTRSSIASVKVIWRECSKLYTRELDACRKDLGRYFDDSHFVRQHVHPDGWTHDFLRVRE